MNNPDFDKIVASTFTQLKQLSLTKGREYSGDHDRLLNFKRNGRDLELEPTTIWRVYAAKHWDAVGQHIRDIQQKRERVLSEPIESRIDDLILYLLLLKGLLEERRDQTVDISTGDGLTSIAAR